LLHVGGRASSTADNVVASDDVLTETMSVKDTSVCRPTVGVFYQVGGLVLRCQLGLAGGLLDSLQVHEEVPVMALAVLVRAHVSMVCMLVNRSSAAAPGALCIRER
jgi:hypothetical protein